MNLLDLDFSLFYHINTVWTNPFLDMVFPFWRNKVLWVPLYFFIGLFLIINFKRKGLWIVLCLAATIGLCDFTSSSILKPLVKRERPCNDVQIRQYVRNLVRCGPGKSFTSSHATNHFGIAFFLCLLFGKRWRWMWFVGLFWAASISYGQVYVGVHYPMDVIGGAILGSLIARLMVYFCRSFIDLTFLDNLP